MPRLWPRLYIHAGLIRIGILDMDAARMLPLGRWIESTQKLAKESQFDLMFLDECLLLIGQNPDYRKEASRIALQQAIASHNQLFLKLMIVVIVFQLQRFPITHDIGISLDKTMSRKRPKWSQVYPSVGYIN